MGFIGSKTEAQETPFLLGSESDVGGLGFTIGMRYYFTESSQPRTKSNTEYAEYRLEMEKLNFSREKSGLKPAPVMTYDQWAGNLYQPRPDAKVRTVDEWIEEDANRNLVPDSYERSR